MSCLIVKYKKTAGLRVTTSEFVLSVSKSIDLCKLKVDPEWGQRNLFSKRLLGSQNTAYIDLRTIRANGVEE
jgi:hypothetical protein